MPIHVLMYMFLKKHPLTKLVVVAGLFLFVQCRSLEEGPAPKQSETAPHLAMRAWETVVTRQGSRRVAVRADSLSRPSAQGKAYFEGHVRVVFFGAQGDTSSILSAARGSVDSGGKFIAVSGKVIVLAGDSTRLETDSLRWDRENERIYGDGLVSIFRPEGREQGVGFDASADLKQWTLRQVRTHVTGKGQ
ncbi:MAG: LPS export ABC transporter protein LptC [Candidatus Latescibacterota bacterium]|jgi:LPS export ABC transporter protein LptC